MKILFSLALLLSLNVAAQDVSSGAETAPVQTQAPVQPEPVVAPEKSQPVKEESKVRYSVFATYGNFDADFKDGTLYTGGQKYTGEYKLLGDGAFMLGADVTFRFRFGLSFYGGVERISIDASEEQLTINANGVSTKTTSKEPSNFSGYTPQLGIGWQWSSIDLFLTLGKVLGGKGSGLYQELKPDAQAKIMLRYRFEHIYLALNFRSLGIDSYAYSDGATSALTGVGYVGGADLGIGYRF